MKVGLCCCYNNHNYGSMLQALANYIAITRAGCECEIINYKKQYTLPQKIKQIPRFFNAGNIAKWKRKKRQKQLISQFPEIQEQRKIRDKSFDSFCSSSFTNISAPYIGYQALQDGSKNYDAVLVGSDQLWLPAGLPTNFYNLQFAAEGVERISYATSFGVEDIPWYQRSRTADFLRRIDWLSVRENSGADICRRVAGVEAKVVVDPTLLLTREEWFEIIPKCNLMEQQYIFCYFLGHNSLCRKEAQRISEQTGLPIVVLKHLDEIIPEDESFGDIALYDVNPADFVNLIRHAEYVLTDSFHGTVFSIINHKRFATYYRFANSDKQSRNSRINNLLSHLGLEQRLVTQPTETMSVLEIDTDYEVVDKSLAQWRSASWDFLNAALLYNADKDADGE